MTTKSSSFGRPFTCFAAILAASTFTALAAQPSTEYGRLPLSFEANHGQSDPQVKFQSRGVGYGIFLTGSGAVLSLADDKRHADIIRMELTGARAAGQVTGIDQLSGRANYFNGNDASKWHTDVPTYAKVEYHSVYPGIDLVYYGNQRQLEYDLVVAPGADPKAIQLRFAGAETLRLNPTGDLSVVGKNGTIAFHKPIVYQIIEKQQKSVEGRFQLLANNTITFKLGRYDHSQTLIIDPTLEYSTYLGAAGSDSAQAIAIDASGNSYITGYTYSVKFPTTSDAYQKSSVYTTNTGVSAIFVSKLNAAGTALDYSTYLTGTEYHCFEGPNNNALTLTGDYGSGIAVDSSGNAYVTGGTCANDFPTTKGAFQTTYPSEHHANNVFITKLNPAGSELTYSTYVGGIGAGYSGDWANGIVLDPSGNGDVYVAGQTSSPDYPTTKGAFETTNPNIYGKDAAFVTKMNAEGTALVYSTYLGGTGGDFSSATPGDSVQAITVNASGNIYVAGYTYSKDFPVKNPYQSSNKAFTFGGSNAFVTELNTAGTALVFSTYLGGSTQSSALEDSANAIAIDATGDVYIAGTAASTNFPTSSDAYQKTAKNKFYNGFITKLNSTGLDLVYSTYLSGSGQTGCGGDGILALDLDSDDNAYLTGSTCSSNFPVTSGAYQTSNKAYSHKSRNAFLTRLNATGSALEYSTYFGGSSNTANAFGDGGNALTFVKGNLYLAGSTESTNFPVTSSAYQKLLKASPAGNSNAFISKFDFASATTTSLKADAATQKLGVKVTFTADVLPATGAGASTGTVDFSIDGGKAVAEILDDTGHAEYSTTTLTEGTHFVVASYLGDATHLASSSAKLTETIYGAISTLKVVSGSGQTSKVNTAYKLPLVVIAKDAKGDVIPELVVTYSGTGLKFSSTSATTKSTGEASVTATPTKLGSLKATATSGDKTVSFALTATSTAAATPDDDHRTTIADAADGSTLASAP